MSTKSANATVTTIEAAEASAKTALAIYKKIHVLEQKLNPFKDMYRLWFGEDGHTINVPGYGKVQIKRGSPESVKTTLVVDEAAWNQLVDDEIKKKLQAFGVIKYEQKKTAARAPSVTFTLNV